MTTYQRAIEIVNEAYDGQITEIVESIDINRANLLIDENEFRNTVSFILDSDYYYRRISDNPPDNDIVNIIATRLRSTLPYQDIQRINTQRNEVISELSDINLANARELESSLNSLISQSAIESSSTAALRELIQERGDYNAILGTFNILNAKLPCPALRANLDLYYRDTQALNEHNDREIQIILDRYIEFDPPYLDVNITNYNEEEEEAIGLAGSFFYDCSS